EEDIGKIYRRMGLTDNAIRTIAVGRPQQDVFYHAREYGQRLLSLPLGSFELDCLARNSAEDHEVMEILLAQEGREGFAAAWLRHCGWEEEACYVEQWPHAHSCTPDAVSPPDLRRGAYDLAGA